MTRVVRLNEVDFDFFAQASDRRDPADREAIRETLVSLWEAVRDLLPDPDGRLMGEIYAGPIEAGSANAWAQTNRDDNHQDVVNLTFELTSDDLQLNVVGGTTPQREQLERWLKASGGAFWTTHPEWELVVFVRRARGDRFFIKAPWEELARYPAGDMRNKGIVVVRSDHGRGLDAQKARLAYHVRQAWTREQVLELGEELVPTLAAAVQDVIPALRQARNA